MVRQLVPRAGPDVSVTSAAEISSQCCVITQLKSVDSTDRQSDSVRCHGPLNQERAVALLKLDALVEFSHSAPLCNVLRESRLP